MEKRREGKVQQDVLGRAEGNVINVRETDCGRAMEAYIEECFTHKTGNYLFFHS